MSKTTGNESRSKPCTPGHTFKAVNVPLGATTVTKAIPCDCGKTAMAATFEPDEVFVVTANGGTTESFSRKTIDTLVALGLIEHETSDFTLINRTTGRDVGPLHHFYRGVTAR